MYFIAFVVDTAILCLHFLYTTKQNHLREAESCVRDYREFQSSEEKENAEKAIDQAISHLVEVLEDMKQSDEKVNTEEFVKRIKQLRTHLVPSECTPNPPLNTSVR